MLCESQPRPHQEGEPQPHYEYEYEYEYESDDEAEVVCEQPQLESQAQPPLESSFECAHLTHSMCH